MIILKHNFRILISGIDNQYLDIYTNFSLKVKR